MTAADRVLFVDPEQVGVAEAILKALGLSSVQVRAWESGPHIGLVGYVCADMLRSLEGARES